MKAMKKLYDSQELQEAAVDTHHASGDREETASPSAFRFCLAEKNPSTYCRARGMHKPVEKRSSC